MPVRNTHEFLVLVENPENLRQYCLNNQFDIKSEYSDPDEEETLICVLFNKRYNTHNKPIILERYLKGINAEYVYYVY